MPWWGWVLLASLALLAVFVAGWVAASIRYRAAVDWLTELAAPAGVDEAWADYEAALAETEKE